MLFLGLVGRAQAGTAYTSEAMHSAPDGATGTMCADWFEVSDYDGTLLVCNHEDGGQDIYLTYGFAVDSDQLVAVGWEKAR
jgi:hypothetical protein